MKRGRDEAAARDELRARLFSSLDAATAPPRKAPPGSSSAGGGDPPPRPAPAPGAGDGAGTSAVLTSDQSGSGSAAPGPGPGSGSGSAAPPFAAWPRAAFYAAGSAPAARPLPAGAAPPPAPAAAPSDRAGAAAAGAADAGGDDDFYAEFPRQAQAFLAADERHAQRGASASPALIWSFEPALRAPGSAPPPRRFVAATIASFWARYARCPADRRHAYEILREGRPCHLYLDLEFNRAANPHLSVLDGDELARAVVRSLLRRLWADHGAVPASGAASATATGAAGAARAAASHGAGASDAAAPPGGAAAAGSCGALAPPPGGIWGGGVLELDSTTETKYSRHILIKLAGAAFASTQDLQTFIRAWAEGLLAERPDEEEGWSAAPSAAGPAAAGAGGRAAPAPVPAAGGLDTGSAAAVAPAGPKGPSPVPPCLGARLLVNKEPPSSADSEDPSSAGPPRPPQTFLVDLGVYTRNRAFRLVYSSKATRPGARLLPTLRTLRRFVPGAREEQVGRLPACRELLIETLAGHVLPDVRLIRCAVAAGAAGGGAGATGRGARGPAAAAGRLSGAPAAPYSAARAPGGTGPSLYPLADALVCRIGAHGGQPGRVRCWALFEDTHLVVFSMSASRFCRNLNREHRSNNVIYVLDYAAGTWVQKCHDPECRHYRSPPVPLPDEVQVEYEETAAAIAQVAAEEAANWQQALVRAATMGATGIAPHCAEAGTGRDPGAEPPRPQCDSRSDRALPSNRPWSESDSLWDGEEIDADALCRAVAEAEAAAAARSRGAINARGL